MGYKYKETISDPANDKFATKEEFLKQKKKRTRITLSPFAVSKLKDPPTK